jgi:hypothetical protein
MTLYVAGVFSPDALSKAVDATFAKVPERPAASIPQKEPIHHTYARPQGDRVRVFLHDLQSQFTCAMEQILPKRPLDTELHYLQEVTTQLVIMAFEDRIESIRSSSSDPPFTSISLDVLNDPMYDCRSVGMTVSSRAADWRKAMRLAMTEVMKLREFGITKDELKLIKSMFLKNVEDDAEQNDTVTSEEWLEDLMTADVLGHAFQDYLQALAVVKRCLKLATLEHVNAACRCNPGRIERADAHAAVPSGAACPVAPG